MTTPQHILYDLQSKMRDLEQLLKGAYVDDDEPRLNIYEMCKAIEIEVTEFNERMELLEDKMNLIIKLLGKDDNEKT